MFTILHKDKDGNERLREDAVEVRRLRQPETRAGEVVTEPGLLVRWSDGIETHYPFLPTAPAEDVFVMNRFGATVATYRL